MPKKIEAAKSSPGAQQGRYVKLVQTDKNTLELVPTTGIQEFIKENVDHLPEEFTGAATLPRHNVWGDHQILQELLKDVLASGWSWVNAKEIEAYTDAPILEAPDGRVYWHNKNQVQSAGDELLNKQVVVFEGAPANKASKAAAKVAVTPIPDVSPAGAPAAPAAPAAAAPAPPPPPVPVAPKVTIPESVYAGMTTEALSEMIKTLTSLKDFVNDKVSQQMVEGMSEELKSRPIEVEEQKTAASKTAIISDDNTGEVIEGDTSLPSSRDEVDDNTGIDVPALDSLKKFAASGDETLEVDGIEYRLETWFERDRAYVELLDETNNRSIFEAWDGALRELLEDGFIDRSDYIGSAIQYAKEMGWLKPGHPPVVMKEQVEEPEESFEDEGELEHTASAKTALISDEDTGVVLEGDKSLPSGHDEEETIPGVTEPATESLDKFAAFSDKETGKVLEGDKSLPSGHDHAEEVPGVTKPATESLDKFAAAEMSTAKALKQAEDMAEKLQGLYLSIKPITAANDTRPVREAVEAIFKASTLFAEAQKALAKQLKQEEAEAVLIESKVKPKKSGLTLAAAEEVVVKKSSIRTGLSLAAAE